MSERPEKKYVYVNILNALTGIECDKFTIVCHNTSPPDEQSLLDKCDVDRIESIMIVRYNDLDTLVKRFKESEGKRYIISFTFFLPGSVEPLKPGTDLTEYLVHDEMGDVTLTLNVIKSC